MERHPTSALVVDDQASFRRTAAAVLKATGAFTQIDEVDGGEQAIAALACHDYSLVLMDVQMPGVNGIDAARVIRVQFPRAAVILMSATAREHLAEDARLVDAAYLAKADLHPDEVEATWRRLAASRAAGPGS